jgi:two-component system C4-dicarboxylate transport response regulator DctD
MTITGPIMLVDDDAALSTAIAASLELAGHHVIIHRDARAALAGLDRRFAGAIISDLRMPGMDGWQFFAAVRQMDPDLPLIFITGHGNIDQAVSALKAGAYDFVAKPFDPDRLLAIVARALEKRQLVLDNRRLAAIAANAAPDPLAHLTVLAGDDPAMQALRDRLGQIGDADIDLLILAEPGCGRDRVARAVHDRSRRRARAFVPFNCAAVPAEAQAAELFGQPGPRGSRGRLAQAAQGTLFLDGIEALAMAAQLQLLAALPAQDVRVIAAATAPPGQLHPELLIRLGGVRLLIPPLRQRRDDVVLLFGQLAALAAPRLGQALPPINASVRAHLIAHDWPGNLAELENYAQRFVLGLAEEGPAVADDASSSLAERLARVEAGLLREALDRHGGRIEAVMAALSLPRKTLYDKLARHGIDPRRYRPPGKGRP